MISAFVDEFAGAILQLLIFSIIPFVWWIFSARKKEGFFRWIGLKRVVHSEKVMPMLTGDILAAALYCVLTYLGEIRSRHYGK